MAKKKFIIISKFGNDLDRINIHEDVHSQNASIAHRDIEESTNWGVDIIVMTPEEARKLAYKLIAIADNNKEDSTQHSGVANAAPFNQECMLCDEEIDDDFTCEDCPHKE